MNTPPAPSRDLPDNLSDQWKDELRPVQPDEHSAGQPRQSINQRH